MVNDYATIHDTNLLADQTRRLLDQRRRRPRARQQRRRRRHRRHSIEVAVGARRQGQEGPREQGGARATQGARRRRWRVLCFFLWRARGGGFCVFCGGRAGVCRCVSWLCFSLFPVLSTVAHIWRFFARVLFSTSLHSSRAGQRVNNAYGTVDRSDVAEPLTRALRRLTWHCLSLRSFLNALFL